MIKELIPYLVILVVVILFRTYIATLVKVNGPSMLNTLVDGDVMLVNRLAKIKRYDIVITDKKTNSLIKRVYGLPNDTIECINNTIYINGEAIEDKYATNETSDFQLIKLKDNEYFLLGDNRLVSADSRINGPIERKHIKGTTNFIVFPFHKFGRKE